MLILIAMYRAVIDELISRRTSESSRDAKTMARTLPRTDNG